MALSRSAARTARHRRWLLTMTACGGAAGLVALEGQLREQAQERGQTTVEYAKERASEVTQNLKHATGVAGALLRTAVSSAVDATQQRRFDSGRFHAALATTIADLAADPPARRQLVALGGGYFLDWLLALAYPEPVCVSGLSTNAAITTAASTTGSSSSSRTGAGAGAGREAGAGAGAEVGLGRVVVPPLAAPRRGGGGPGAELGAGTAGRGDRAGIGGDGGAAGAEEEAAEGELGGLAARLGGPAAGLGVPAEGASAVAGAAAAAAAPGARPAASGGGAEAEAGAAVAVRGSREAERALQSLLEDDAAFRLLLDRPGAVPRLLRALAAGWASGGVAAALAARAAEARAADEAVMADLREAVEVLRGRGGGGRALQRVAAGLLAAWAAGSGANRAKLTGLGLPAVVAEVMTAASGMGERSALELQWELLRLARVLAEHTDAADSHHTAACVMPLLYTAADAAAAADAAMASYAVDSLAAAVRNGGAPVSEQVSNSTMSHLLWQLAEAMGAGRAPTAAAPMAAAAAEGPAGQRKGQGPAGPAVAAAAAGAPGDQKQGGGGSPSRSVWSFVGFGWRWSSSPSPAPSPSPSSAAASSTHDVKTHGPAVTAAAGGGGDGDGGGGGGGDSVAVAAGAVVGGGGGGDGGSAGGAAAPARRAGDTTMLIKDPYVVASVAAAVSELARASLLPEAQVPRWRDWLLDVLCAEGFEPAPGGANGTAVTAPAAAAAAAAPSPVGRPIFPHNAVDASIGAATTTSTGADGRGGSAAMPPITHTQQQPSQVPAPHGLRDPATASSRREEGGPGGRLPAGASGDGAVGAAVGGAGSRAAAVAGSLKGGRGAALPPWLSLPLPLYGRGGAGGAQRGRRREPEDGREGGRERQLEALRGSVVAALSALSHMPGNHGLQAAHYWLSRLLSELAARTLPYTSLVYAEGPRDPQALVNAVPVLPSYVRSVADALERAADAVAEDSPPLPPHLEFELAGSGLVGRAPHSLERDRAAAAAYRRAAHVVDVVVAERKAADALEALCAIVAPDPDKQRWLLRRGVLPLLHRLTRTADDPRIVLREEGQPGAEQVEAQQAAEAAAAATATATDAAELTAVAAATAKAQHPHPPHPYLRRHPQPEPQPRPGQGQVQGQQPQQQTAVVVSELLSDHEGGPSLCLQRQVARMLALVALLPEANLSLSLSRGGIGYGHGLGHGLGLGPRGSTVTAAAADARARSAGGAAAGSAGGGGDWLAWLRQAASSSDCRLSSNATRALLHAAAVDANAAAAAPPSPRLGAGGGGGVAAALPPVFLDGIHLLNPVAGHHWALVWQAAEAAAAATATAPAGTTADAQADTEVGRVGPKLPVGQAAAGAAVAAAAPAAAAPPPEAVDGSRSAAGATTREPYTTAMSSTSPGQCPGPAAVAASALYGTLSYIFSRATPLWATSGLASFADASGGGAVAATLHSSPPPPQPIMAPPPTSAAATAAEPLQADPHNSKPMAAATTAAASGTAAGADGVAHPANPAATAALAPSTPPPPARPPPPPPDTTPSSSSTAPAAAGDRSTANAAAGMLLPPDALAPYPAPYPASDYAEPCGPQDSGLGLGHHQDGLGAGPRQEDGDVLPPLVDVVFVHGIRGGPFITWRKAGVMTRGSAASHMERSACWPSTWLAEDFPRARLLSVEYLAPVSAWEGESLPLEDNVSRVMGQLAAAGVGTGQRPVVFVAHSMGGLLVKEMLARSVDQAAEGGPHASLAASTRGIVFFGTPHFGNTMAALGWKLRHVPGAHPAPSLARLTPGPHLLSLNQRLRELHEVGGGSLRVVSLLEGLPTQLSGVIPRILVVAPDSAYPGFGAALTLPQNDHIDCCKPDSKAAVSYKVVRDMVRHAMRSVVSGGVKAAGLGACVGTAASWVRQGNGEIAWPGSWVAGGGPNV